MGLDAFLVGAVGGDGVIEIDDPDDLAVRTDGVPFKAKGIPVF
jgi:hypothetical protein